VGASLLVPAPRPLRAPVHVDVEAPVAVLEEAR